MFFQGHAEQHDKTWATAAIRRGHQYAEAGADGFFLPGLKDSSLMARIAKEAPLPLNILVTAAKANLSALSSSGVARVSYGGNPYADAMQVFEEAARKANG